MPNSNQSVLGKEKAVLSHSRNSTFVYIACICVCVRTFVYSICESACALIRFYRVNANVCVYLCV